MNYLFAVAVFVLTIFGFIRAYKAKSFQKFNLLTLTICFLCGSIMYWGELWLTSFSKNQGPDSLSIIGFLGIILALGTIVSFILFLIFQRNNFRKIKQAIFENGIGVVILLFDAVLIFTLQGSLPMIYWWIPLISAICGIVLIIKH